MATNKTLMRFTGVGGQGVLLAGAIFAAAKINDGGYGSNLYISSKGWTNSC